MLRGKFCIILLASCLAFAGCARDGTRAKKAQLQRPRDEASLEERAQINATVARIETLTKELGQPKTFRTLPIILSNEDSYTDHPAGCVSVEGGDPQFIVIKRSVFDKENDLAGAGVETSLFRVLLHEIGHCYFGRAHEEERLYTENMLIELGTLEGEQPLVYPVLDVSVMVPESLTLPVALEKYYVAELLGISRAKKVEDFMPYVKKSRLVEAPEPLRVTRSN